MSRKKKLSHKQKMQRRLVRQFQNSDMPPPAAILAYQEVFEWAEKHPEEAQELVALGEAELDLVAVGIVQARRDGAYLREAAWKLRAWFILHGYKYAYDWPDPLALMSDDDIIHNLCLDFQVAAASNE